MIRRRASSSGVNCRSGPEQVERLDLLAHELVDPVELRLELGLGLEVPCHCASPSSTWQNRILVTENAILARTAPARWRTSRPRRSPPQTLAGRSGRELRGEVRRLLDAALEVMRRCGTTSRPRVADIVAAAGLSNDAFYRHFRSKDALVAALLEDGAERLRSYLAHQMAKDSAPEPQVRRWVEGVLSQAATTTSRRRRSRCCGTAAASAGPTAAPPCRPAHRWRAPRRAVRRARERRCRAGRVARRARRGRPA